jgi:hypothetical protein
MRPSALFLLPLVLTAGTPAGAPDGLRQSLETLRRVGLHNRGSREAAAAWKTVAAADPDQLPLLLGGMDGASPLARNWIRSAVEDVLDRTKAERHSLPLQGLEAFLLDRKHDPQARRLAYELIAESDARAADRFLPGMLDDPSPELRRDAVARLLDRAEKLQKDRKKEEAVPLFRQAFASARARDQLDRAAKALKTLGYPVDLAAHLGLIADWKVIGPFPGSPEQGLDTVYPPEKSIDLDARYEGKKGKVRWKDYVTKDPYGVVDLNAAVGDEPAAVGYALAEFTAARPRAVELRLGCYNAFKLWVNGDLVLDRRDAFTGMSLDHYVGKAHLRAGKNRILVKLYREDPPPPTPKWWRFQLRVCDDDGRAILSTTRPPTPDAGNKDRG